MIEQQDTTNPANLVPLQGNPGFQEHRRCHDCDGKMDVTEVIWESHGTKRVTMRCRRCTQRLVTNRDNYMFRHRITIDR